MQSNARGIETRVAEAPEGAIFIASDFSDLASDDAIRQTLARLTASGELERPIRGVYRKPRFIAFLSEASVAPPDEIANAIARKFNWSIAPSGDTALNTLGLDTQVPAVYQYVSDGPYRSYEYGPFVIEFKHTANREISTFSATTAIVVQALKAKGKGNVTEKDLRRIVSKLNENQIECLQSESKNTTVWIRETIKRIYSLKENGNA